MKYELKFDEYKECLVCGGNDFSNHKYNDSYIICNNCEAIYKKNLYSDNADIVKIYGDVDLEYMRKLLIMDRNHYRKMFKKINCKDLIERVNDKIYALGGGLPKLESHLKHNKIIIYDACSNGYVNHVSNFNRIYKYEKNIIWNNYFYDENKSFYDDILSKISNKSKNLLTFVHFLEHLRPSLFYNLFLDLCKLKETSNNNNKFLIYQPNCKNDRHEKWCHWHPDHLVLFPFNTYIKFIKKMGFNIICSYEYCDDLLIYFE